MDIKTLYNCARDEFNLPSYKDKAHKIFVAKGWFADYNLQDYFNIPAIKCKLYEIEDVKDAVQMKISWDRSGDDVLVYPDQN